MECSRVKTILFEYTDTEIPVEFRKEVEAHLSLCGSCARQVEALREQSNALRTMPKVEAPADFLEQVRSRLEKPSILSRLKDGLSVLFTGKHFFQLAGAAATAVLVIASTQMILRDGGQKALLSPVPPSIVSPPSVQAPPASPARPQALPDVRRENGTTFNGALPSTAHDALTGTEERSVSLTLKLSGASPKLKLRGGTFKAESFSAAAPAAEMRAPDEKKLKKDVTKGAAGTAGTREAGAPPEAQKISSDVIRLIRHADGKVLSAAPSQADNQPGTLLAEMPAANYPSFLDQMRQLGEVEFSGDKDFNPAPDAKVRVSVSFGTRD